MYRNAPFPSENIKKISEEGYRLSPDPSPLGREKPLPRSHPDLAPSNENFWVRPCNHDADQSHIFLIYGSDADKLFNLMSKHSVFCCSILLTFEGLMEALFSILLGRVGSVVGWHNLLRNFVTTFVHFSQVSNIFMKLFKLLTLYCIVVVFERNKWRWRWRKPATFVSSNYAKNCSILNCQVFSLLVVENYFR